MQLQILQEQNELAQQRAEENKIKEAETRAKEQIFPPEKLAKRVESGKQEYSTKRLNYSSLRWTIYNVLSGITLYFKCKKIYTYICTLKFG